MVLFKGIILAIDDDVDDIQLLSEALAEHATDVQLIAVQTSDEFFRYIFGADIDAACWISALPTQMPDLILLDLNMPKLSGLEVLQLIRKNEQLHSCKVAMLTTSVNPNDERVCRKAGADLYLIKPSSFAELVKLCAVLLQQVLPMPRSVVVEVFNARQ